MKTSKNEIINCAEDILLSQGIDALSMRKIAVKLNISATAIYRHFSDKDEILLSIVDRCRETFVSYLNRSLKEKSPTERLKRTGELYIDFGLNNISAYKIMFMSWDQLDMKKHSSEYSPGKNTNSFIFLIERIKEVLPLLEGQDVIDTALYLWSHLHGLVSLYISGNGKDLFSKKDYQVMCNKQITMALNNISNS